MELGGALAILGIWFAVGMASKREDGLFILLGFFALMATLAVMGL